MLDTLFWYPGLKYLILQIFLYLSEYDALAKVDPVSSRQAWDIKVSLELYFEKSQSLYINVYIL